jgi:antitoxin component YwqK of YwqJK toxin-antitoxin module
MIFKKTIMLAGIITMFLFTGCANGPTLGKKIDRSYYTGGQLRTEAIWDDPSKQNGIIKEYGFEGQLVSTVTVKNRVKNGYQILYDKKGRVIRKTPYVKGKIQGQEKSFYPNGDPMLIFEYKNGVKEGYAYAYYKNGKLYKKTYYKNGKPR